MSWSSFVFVRQFSAGWNDGKQHVISSLRISYIDWSYNKACGYFLSKRHMLNLKPKWDITWAIHQCILMRCMFSTINNYWKAFIIFNLWWIVCPLLFLVTLCNKPILKNKLHSLLWCATYVYLKMQLCSFLYINHYNF